MLEETSKSSSSSCNVVLVPRSVDVIDTVFANTMAGSSALNSIQIMRFATPFSKHKTFNIILVISRAIRHNWTSFGMSFLIISK